MPVTDPAAAIARVRRVLEEAVYDAFLARYRERLVDELGDRAPYSDLFKRILVWGRFG